jgi:ketosteroid isomerase-like protein
MQGTGKQSNVPAEALAAMRQTNEWFNSEVVSKGNIDGLDRVYTRHAHVLPPGAPMVEGREEIKQFWKQAIAAMGVTGAQLATVHAEAAGDGIVEIGRADLTTADGQTATVKYVVHWKQEDGNWKWNIDIWNSNQ